MKIIKFSAAWCGPCRSFKPVYERVVNELKLDHQEIDIDSDEAADLLNKFHIQSIPQVHIIDNEGNSVAKIIGAKSEEEFRKFIGDNYHE